VVYQNSFTAILNVSNAIFSYTGICSSMKAKP
jgi:hypothetical protein